MLKRESFLASFLCAIAATTALAQRPGDSVAAVPYFPPWNFMSLSTAAVDTFLVEHPTYDGRGVMVLIFDTGIDPSIPGLQQTSTGSPKVVDLVDVSGSNVVKFIPARREGNLLVADGLPVALRDVASVQPPSVDNTWYIGAMDESRYMNATVRDFDGDGVAESRFGALLYRASDGWRVVLDADTDSSLAGEKSLRSYREDRETLTFPQKNDYSPSPITMGVSIDPDAHEAVFHYDMNGHATHVAGIAAGQAINGEAGFNGVAPGAQLISVKFSSDPNDDLTIAGTMVKAYEYAARLADSLAAHDIPVVVNMSFGIGSAYEGKADMEEYLNELLPQHPNLYVVTSAGNEGPGLSTVGIPAAASRVIAVGALLPEGIGRDSYSAMIDRDILWDFSSRGGEADKPDVIAPGSAVSTITRFSFDMRASGTSMASPYTAGVVALLLSAMAQEYPGWIPSQSLIRRALRVSAVPLPEYAPIEQGGGVVNVRRAYELLKKWKRSGFADAVQEYAVSTFNPNYPDGEGTAAFWRSGYVPGERRRQEFTIFRQPAVEPDPDVKSSPFFRAYTLESTAPWMKSLQKTVYIREDEPATVEVLYDRSKMTEPGLYSGKIIARRAGGKKATPADEVEFELVNSVIVPYHFSPERDYKVAVTSQKVRPGGTRRFYFAPPTGASALTFTLSVPKGSQGVVFGSIADRTGATDNYLPRILGTERTEGSSTVSLSKLGDGVIEVVVQGEMFEGGGEDAEFSLSAECLMLDLDVETYTAGRTRELSVTARNGGTAVLDGKMEYTLKGYARTVRDTIRNNYYRAPVKLSRHDGALWISVAFPPEEYMRATDIMVRLIDSAGQAQAQEDYNSPEEWVFLPNFERGEEDKWYFLEIVFGAAIAAEREDATEGEEDPVMMEEGDADAVPFRILEKHVRPTDYLRLDSYGEREIYPNIPRVMTGILPELEGGIPEGYKGLGEIRFTRSGYDEVRLEMEFLTD